MNELQVHSCGGNNAVLILVTPSAEMNIFFHKNTWSSNNISVGEIFKTSYYKLEEPLS